MNYSRDAVLESSLTFIMVSLFQLQMKVSRQQINRLHPNEDSGNIDLGHFFNKTIAIQRMVGKSEKVIRFYQWYYAGYVHILMDIQAGSGKPSEETI